MNQISRKALGTLLILFSLFTLFLPVLHMKSLVYSTWKRMRIDRKNISKKG
ncbi:hypothetical protein [Massilicoli timonensis]|uniref:Uncharacterized protein n=1 Tax=Massilicoli timonensis TaxID=2015901 RepID=A0ABT1SNB6_9FIRM|nr:hypothetical protein [Massilicoli timonensis]MCQ5122732.1 hypothetical protein [Massilicoli timonensis]